MNTPATLTSGRLRTSWVAHALGLVAGIGFTGAIAVGLAYFSQAPASQREAADYEIRAVEIPEPPPPPLPQTAAPHAAPPPLALDFDFAPSPGGIPLAISVPTLAPPVPQPAVIRFNIEDLGTYQPTANLAHAETQQVYRVAEVDRRPVAIKRTFPAVLQSSLARIEKPHVVLLFIVKPNGRADDIQVIYAPNDDLAAAAIEALDEWKFRPAMKGGKVVRCLVQQTIVLGKSDKSPFSR